MRKTTIPLGKPFLGDEEREAVEEILSTKRIATGDTVRDLEAALAKKFGRKYCVAVNSGTVALSLAVKVTRARSVIVPALTCASVLYAVLNAGSNVIFADVDRETHNLSLPSLSRDQLSTADAVVVTHTYGHAADMDELDVYLKPHGLLLIEDFAQATGGYFRDGILGSFGKIAVTSFYASKGITAGHGGAILTDDEELYLRCIYARGSRTSGYYQNLIPMNYQMTDIQAAIGLVQLSKLDMMIEMRRKVASKYVQELESAPIELVRPKEWVKHAYYKYAIVLPAKVAKQRLIAKMGECGIELGSLYDPPLHKNKVAGDFVKGKAELPIAEYLAPRTLSLPMFPGLSEEDVEKVCKTITSLIIGDQE